MRDNLLGVALMASMKVPQERRLEIARQAWRRLVQCLLNEKRRYLICECVDAYTPLEPGQRQVIKRDVLSDQESEARAIFTPKSLADLNFEEPGK
jgi:hypothetical protein